MVKHKWHKEIKHWADGGEIEHLKLNGQWQTELNPEWQEYKEYRIKPQPKEPQYLYVYNYLGDIDFFTYKVDNQGYMGKIKLEDTENE